MLFILSFWESDKTYVTLSYPQLSHLPVLLHSDLGVCFFSNPLAMFTNLFLSSEKSIT
jgi:hypothetical protein